MKAILYSKDNCPFCVKAIDLLTEKKFNITVIKLFKDISKEDMQAEVEKLTGTVVNTVPQIFLGEDLQYVGGYTDLQSYFKNLELDNSINGPEIFDFEI